MSPLRLSDAQMAAILAAAHPLERRARGAFLTEIAQLLAEQPELGDGSLHRMLMQVQRRHFDVPDLSHADW